MSAAQQVNQDAEVVGRDQALEVNCMAAAGLQRVLKTNLGPRGTLKMLVGGAGQIKLTKDGNILLHEMQVMHPTAAMVARAATAQDDITGDGTTSNVLFTAELLKQSQRYLNEGLHARVLVDGLGQAQAKAIEFLDSFKARAGATLDRELLCTVARTSLRTKLQPELADQMTEIVCDAILCVKREAEPIDLHMVEILHLISRHASDTRLVRGLVLDHGARHPDMPSELADCFVMTLNVSLEYEKTEVQSGFFYSSAEERDAMVAAERRFTDEKVAKIIELKRQVCTPENGKKFFIVNQQGIDILSLDMFAKEGIVALRRAKRRNMERLTLACGGYQVNSVDDLTPDCLGQAGRVWQTSLGDEKFTFVEDVQNPRSCSIMIHGPNPHTIAQLKDAVRDGLRAVKNAIEDECVIPGAGAFEIACHRALVDFKREVSGRAKLGVQAFADALLVIPKTLANNSGLDSQEVIITLEEEHERTGQAVGLDLDTGGPMLPDQVGVWDNYRVKRQFIHLSTTLASQLLLVDEVIRAGRKMGKEQKMNM